MAATVLAFPQRGGNGFSIPRGTKYKKLDITNLCSLNLARSIKEERERYPDERDFSFQRTPEMLICMALYRAMSSEQRARAMMIVNETHVKCCDEDTLRFTVMSSCQLRSFAITDGSLSSWLLFNSSCRNF